MSARGTPGSSQGDRVARATALIRALKGVVDARVEMDATGIRTVAVVVEPPLSAWEITRNVQSALLASLGLTIDTAIVEVSRPGVEPSAADARAAVPEPAAPVKTSPKNAPAASYGKRSNDKSAVPVNGNGKSNGKVKVIEALTPPVVASAPAAPARRRQSASVARLELEVRGSGRMGCRVVVATSDRIAAGESDGLDTPSGRLEAVARAVVAASRIPGAALDAIRLVELAGRTYVIVAVRAWSGRDTIYRAEVAAVEASPEAAAASATLSALVQ